MLGELEEGGGQLAAIDALGVLPAARRPRLEVWVNGSVDPAYARRCRERVRELGLEGAVALLRTRAEPLGALARADLLLDLSAGGAPSAATALALACGVPVLALDAALRGAAAEVPWLRCPGGQAAEVAASLLDALDLPLARRREISEAGYRWARRDLHPQRLASELMHLYAADLGSGPASPGQ
jgi:glycosyltransferase involved in cell wall biosynthesis